MKRKLKSDRGFTLAELLIVVAIIGVLVAIAIPIFTSQLERSREAVDLSDVRSAYAEVPFSYSFSSISPFWYSSLFSSVNTKEPEPSSSDSLLT